MDLTGTRWGLERAEAVLKLRSLQSSGDFEEYFYFYKQQSLHLYLTPLPLGKNLGVLYQVIYAVNCCTNDD
jgi:hypothetical protein